MIKHTLAALALTATIAQPAAANDDVFKGILATIIIHKVLNSTDQGYSDGHNQHHTTVEIRSHYPQQVCSREIERLRNGSTMVHEMDCRGNVIRSYWR